MKRAVPGRWLPLLLLGCVLGGGSLRAADADQTALADEGRRRPQRQLPPLPRPGRRRRGRHELHPRPRQARRPQEDRRPASPISRCCYKRLSTGKMPPAGEQPRPVRGGHRPRQAVDRGRRPAADAGRPAGRSSPTPRCSTCILADLDRQDRRTRRFLRYFSLAPLANAGSGADELQTYRNALAKLLNSLSWHPRITLPTADRRGRRSSCASTCATTSGTPSSGIACWPSTPTASSTTPPSPGPSSSARPRACPACAPTGSSPTPRWRRCTTICCKFRPICRNWSGSCTSMWRRTCSRSAWRGPASSAPASRATTASSSGTTP